MYQKQNLPIGVFDSGVGGLTVLKAMKTFLPQEDFIYLGDTARLPYGTKSPATIRRYAVQMAKILIERQIKILIIACNTATTAALSYLQNILPGLPIIGVVEPGALAAVSATRNNKIAILATEATIASGAYQHYIKAQLPEAIIIDKSCSLLVALAEEGMCRNEIATMILQYYLSFIKDEDTLLLGCTHFPIFKPLLSQLVKNLTIVDSAQATAAFLQQLLKKQNLFKDKDIGSRAPKYLVTDSIERFRRVGEFFLGEVILSKDIELVDG